MERHDRKGARAVGRYSSDAPGAKDGEAPDQDVLGGAWSWQSGEVVLAAAKRRPVLAAIGSRRDGSDRGKQLLRMTPAPDRTVHRAAYTDSPSPSTTCGPARPRGGFVL